MTMHKREEEMAAFARLLDVLDELRDYRFYAEDLVHPSGQAVECLWSRFLDFCLPAGEREEILAREKILKRSAHRPLH